MSSKCMLGLIMLGGCTGILYAKSTQHTIKKAHQEGKQLAKSLHQQISTQLPNLKPEKVPGFLTDHPKQTDLAHTEGNFDQALHATYQFHPEAQLLKETADKRQKVAFEVETTSVATQQDTMPSEDQETLLTLEGLNDFKHFHETNNQQNTQSDQKELLEGLSTLHLLKEVQESIKNATDTHQPIEIGKGTLHRIDSFIMKAKTSPQPSSMQQQEYSRLLEGDAPINSALATLHYNKRCYYLGRSCLREVLGIPIHERYQFCCFDSEFMRILHEQGRPFVGLDWGTVENPICRGFMLEELNKIPLDKLNFSSLFESLIKNKSFGDIEALQDKSRAYITQHLQQLKSKRQQLDHTTHQEVLDAL